LGEVALGGASRGCRAAGCGGRLGVVREAAQPPSLRHGRTQGYRLGDRRIRLDGNEAGPVQGFRARGGGGEASGGGRTAWYGVYRGSRRSRPSGGDSGAADTSGGRAWRAGFAPAAWGGLPGPRCARRGDARVGGGHGGGERDRGFHRFAAGRLALRPTGSLGRVGRGMGVPSIEATSFRPRFW